MLEVKTKDKKIKVPLGDRTIIYSPRRKLKPCIHCGQDAFVTVEETKRRGYNHKTDRIQCVTERVVIVGCRNERCPSLFVEGCDNKAIRFAGYSKKVRDDAIRGCIKEWEEQN